jgi:hypothetical protein
MGRIRQQRDRVSGQAKDGFSSNETGVQNHTAGECRLKICGRTVMMVVMATLPMVMPMIVVMPNGLVMIVMVFHLSPRATRPARRGNEQRRMTGFLAANHDLTLGG